MFAFLLNLSDRFRNLILRNCFKFHNCYQPQQLGYPTYRTAGAHSFIFFVVLAVLNILQPPAFKLHKCLGKEVFSVFFQHRQTSRDIYHHLRMQHKLSRTGSGTVEQVQLLLTSLRTGKIAMPELFFVTVSC